MIQKVTTPPPLGVYIHWPFCVSKCPYCDFNSHLSKEINVEDWKQAYFNDLQVSQSQTPKHQVKTIFFGGGTPSLMPPRLMESLINRVQTLWACDSDVEISFEANPTSVEALNFKDFKQAGANRVSVGIQAFNDKELKFLGRPHNLKEGMAAIETAKSVFDRMSFDLIYARPNQTLEAWSSELCAALRYAPEHISLYQLTIEPGTAFHTSFSRGDFSLPSEVVSDDLYRQTGEILGKVGLKAYEVSNYSKPGEECRHNLMYWKYHDYVGVGPGAHGRVTLGEKKNATRRHRAPDVWLSNCLRTNDISFECHALSKEQEVMELMLMGLRLVKGVKLSCFERSVGKQPLDYFGEKLSVLMAEGFISLDKNSIKTTPKGRLKINGILSHLFG